MRFAYLRLYEFVFSRLRLLHSLYSRGFPVDVRRSNRNVACIVKELNEIFISDRLHRRCIYSRIMGYIMQSRSETRAPLNLQVSFDREGLRCDAFARGAEDNSHNW